MLEVVLDTETTGLSTNEKHKIVEIGCIELQDQIPTNKIFHEYINPLRPVSKEAFQVHGYSDEFLSNKKTFPEIVEKFLNFIKNKKLVIHNAPFDLSFINYELKLLKLETIDKKNVIDTLEIARAKYPGAQNSLDALCKRFNVDNSKREKHNALIDCQLLKEVYINLLDQKEPKLDLANVADPELNVNNKNISYLKKVIKPSNDEIEEHKNFLKTSLQKNFYN